MPRHAETQTGGGDGRFHPTAWTRVLAARDGATKTAQEALEALIRSYWKPVYFHIRRKGHDVEEAKDLTQGFFAKLLEREALRGVDPGKFRTFLLACLEHHLSDGYDRRDAAKRRIDWDFHAAQAERGYSPEDSFERDWALTVLERALTRLRELAPREARLVEAQRAGELPLKSLAQELGITEGNAKVMAHRGRTRLKALILEELSETLQDPAGAEAELAELFRAISL